MHAECIDAMGLATHLNYIYKHFPSLFHTRSIYLHLFCQEKVLLLQVFLVPELRPIVAEKNAGVDDFMLSIFQRWQTRLGPHFSWFLLLFVRPCL